MRFLQKRILNILLAVSGFIMIITPKILFPVCSSLSPMGHHMKCSYTATLILASGVILFIISIVAVFYGKRWMSFLAGFSAIILTTFSYLIPMQVIKIGNMQTLHWEIGFCSAKGHNCLSKTLPALKIILPVVAILGIINIIMTFLIVEGRKRI